MSDEHGRPPRRRATYEDVQALEPGQVGEIVAGELHVSPRPRVVHGLAASELHGQLWGPFGRGAGGPGGWVLLFEPELHLGQDVLVPDLAGWRRERLPELPDVAAMTLAPDWVCEVLSPSTVRLDRVGKQGAYAREGVRHLWLVDPLAQVLEVYRLQQGQWLLLGTHGASERVRAEPFESLALELGALWQR